MTFAQSAHWMKVKIWKYYYSLEAGEEKDKIYSTLMEIESLIGIAKREKSECDSGRYTEPRYIRDSELQKNLKLKEKSAEAMLNRIRETHNRVERKEKEK